MGLIDGFEHIVRDNEPLAAYTWLRLGGPAAYFAEPTTVDEVAGLVKRFRENELPIRLLGGGSNLLIGDEGLQGLVIHLSAPAFGNISVAGRTVTAGGGSQLAHLVSTSVREGLAGLEPLVGIPGTVGGALHRNSGSHGGDIGQWTSSATVMTRAGKIIVCGKDDLHFAYRQSSLDELVILDARFELEADDPKQLNQRLQKLWIVKRSNQPIGDRNSGCVFKDAGGMNAKDVIDQAGLKGARVGNAVVSDRNSNYICAEPNASANDVKQLIATIQTQVADRLGIELETQLEIW